MEVDPQGPIAEGEMGRGKMKPVSMIGLFLLNASPRYMSATLLHLT
jgi:hypothetical protein